MNAMVAFRKEIPSETDDVMEGQLVVPANATVVKLDKCSLINHHYVVRVCITFPRSIYVYVNCTVYMCMLGIVCIGLKDQVLYSLNNICIKVL